MPQPDVYRHLGIQLTPDLSFVSHISSITNKFRSRVIILSHMSKFIPPSALTILYKCFIRPTIEYAIPIWIFKLTSAEKDTLDKLQARAARSYLHALQKPQDWMTAKDSLNVLAKWDSIHWRRQILSLCYFHHIYYQFPLLLEEFQFLKSNSARRPYSLRLPKASTHFAKSFLFLLSKEWNKLPGSICSIPHPGKFNKLIRDHYASSQYSTKGIDNFCL